MEDIVNKVASSGLITIDLEELYPQGERVVIDIKDHLFHGLVLKEKDFREYIKQEDWSKYTQKYVAVYCSADAIIPVWAFMLVNIQLAPIAKKIVFGDAERLEETLFYDVLEKLDIEQYRDARVVIKGCGKLPVPRSAYTTLAAKLQPVAKSIMYGEPCSTVPLYKKAK